MPFNLAGPPRRQNSKIRFFRLAFYLPLLLLPAVSARAGIVMASSGDSLIRSIYIDGDYMRMDMAEDGEDAGGKLIYRRGDEKNVMVIVDTAESSYYEITSEDMREIKKQIDEAVEMIRELLSQIPEDRREETEPLIRSLIPPEYSVFLDMLKTEKRVVKEKENAEISGYSADMYSVYRNDRKVTEAWFAGAEQFGLEAGDLRVLREFDEFLEIPAPGMVPGLLISEIGDDKSIPLRITELGDDGLRVNVLDVKKISSEDIPPSLFQVPEGFEKKEIGL